MFSPSNYSPHRHFASGFWYHSLWSFQVNESRNFSSLPPDCLIHAGVKTLNPRWVGWAKGPWSFCQLSPFLKVFFIVDSIMISPISPLPLFLPAPAHPLRSLLPYCCIHGLCQPSPWFISLTIAQSNCKSDFSL